MHYAHGFPRHASRHYSQCAITLAATYQRFCLLGAKPQCLYYSLFQRGRYTNMQYGVLHAWCKYCCAGDQGAAFTH